MLVLKRIHVSYRLRADPARSEAIERSHAHHTRRCPVYRSIEKAIAVTTELDLEPLPA